MTAMLRAALRAPSATAGASAAPALRHLRAGSTRLGKADRDRLFAARDLLAGTSAAQRAALALAHHLLDLLRCFLAVLPCHVSSVLDSSRAEKTARSVPKLGRERLAP